MLAAGGAGTGQGSPGWDVLALALGLGMLAVLLLVAAMQAVPAMIRSRRDAVEDARLVEVFRLPPPSALGSPPSARASAATAARRPASTPVGVARVAPPRTTTGQPVRTATTPAPTRTPEPAPRPPAPVPVPAQAPEPVPVTAASTGLPAVTRSGPRPRLTLPHVPALRVSIPRVSMPRVPVPRVPVPHVPVPHLPRQRRADRDLAASGVSTEPENRAATGGPAIWAARIPRDSRLIPYLAAGAVAAVLVARTVPDPGWWRQGGALGFLVAVTGLALAVVGVWWLDQAVQRPRALSRGGREVLRAAEDRHRREVRSAEHLLAGLAAGGDASALWSDFTWETGLSIPARVRASVDPQVSPDALVRYLAARSLAPDVAERSLWMVIAVPVVSCLVPAVLVLAAV